MTATTDQNPTRSRGRIVFGIVAGIIVLLVILLSVFANLFTEVLWYDQLGYQSVLITQWVAAGLTFVAGFLLLFVPIFISIEVAFRTRPVYAKLNSQLDRYQEIIEPLRKLASFAIPGVFGLFGGVLAASNWSVVLTWLNRTYTGQTDPQFGMDISFYLFDLPFFKGVLAFTSAAVLISGVLAVATNYLYGAISVTGREIRISKAARIQMAITASVYLLIQGVSLWLDQYSTLLSSGELVEGASYTDVNAVIPGFQIMGIVAALVAVLFIVTAITGRWRLPLIGTALLIVTSLVVGIGYPWVVQRFQVQPNELTLESPYLQRDIDNTREAYGVDNVEVSPYNATTDAEPGALREDAATTANIRIMDPALLSPTFAQLEQIKQYYGFEETLDVDRYTIEDEVQDAVVAVRELNQAGLGDGASWYNNTLVYTHGYGLVAAYGNQRSDDGQPVFFESGIPTTGSLGEFQPRVYFGENSPAYSIVGADESTSPIEYDGPPNKSSDDSTYTTFDGDGGPKLDNVFSRLLYAIKFGSEQIFLSDAVTDQSQILYNRDPSDRVSKVAPYLTIDSDPYPSVVDGEVVWIVDAYTTSNNYPYSNSLSYGATATDTLNRPTSVVTDNVNYIRNSVKATVNAYDGSVTLYAWDDQDPILQTWQKVFPNTIKPISEMSGDLLSHVRYPADLFKIQRAVLQTYHVTDAGSFYSRENAWSTPNEPTATNTDTAQLQPPYYLTMQLPDQEEPSFSLYTTYIPAAAQGATSRSIMTGYLAADANAGSTAGEVSDQYGTLRLLTLPEGTTVPGPGQVQNSFNSNTTVSQELNLLRQGSSQVISGNLLTVPVGGGLLYVQPVYVKSSGETGYPLLQKVLVSFGENIAFENTLDAALDELFGGESGATAGDSDVDPDLPTQPGGGEDVDPNLPGDNTGGNDPQGEPTATPTPTSTPSGGTSLTDYLEQARDALADRDAAMKAGDWTAYGEADDRLQAALDKALAASE